MSAPRRRRRHLPVHPPRVVLPALGYPSPHHLLYLTTAYFITSVVLACPDLCTCPDASNHATCNDAGLTDVPRNLPPSLTTLDLDNNQIHTLSETSLSSLRNLANLKLKNNVIDTIHNGAFLPVSSLQTLDLSNNKLSELSPVTFQGVSGLLHLDLSTNQLADVDGVFSEMSELSRLDLHDNVITRIDQNTLSELTNLRYLLLAGNRITNIDKKAFKNLEKLTYLVLKGNPISAVTRFQFNSYFLSYVDLSECQLNHVPRGLPNSIRYLQLRRNNLTTIRRHTFQDCPFISILVLDENGINEINEKTFEHMTYLQQLWLNNNNLRRLPHHLPMTLQRLLLDQNAVESVNDNAFPENSQLHTLSLMGNNISYLSHSALYNAPLLQTLDLSNNQLQHIYGHTFLHSNRLETLQLSKNPLQYFHSRSFAGLRLLQTLSLAYIPNVVSLYPDSFDDLQTLSKLDLDSSHWIIRTLLATPALQEPLATVEDLSMRSSDLATLSESVKDAFPNLTVFHISSTRWHCDTSLIWFRNWLLTTTVRVDNRDDITCFTPHDLDGRAITALTDYEFVAPTTLKFSTALPTAPGELTTFPSTTPTTTSATNDKSTTTTSTTTAPTTTTTTSPTSSTTDADDDYYYEKYYKEDEYVDDPLPVPSAPPEPFDLDSLYEEVYRGFEDDSADEVSYDPKGVQDGNLLDIRPLTPSDSSKLPNTFHEGDGSDESTKSTLVIIAATTAATAVVAAVLIIVIVYFSRKHRRKNGGNTRTKKKKHHSNGFHQNGIKYKSRNDVLYFMPKSADGSTSESLQTNTSKEGMTLVPGRDINHEGPLRVYKWEDF